MSEVDVSVCWSVKELLMRILQWRLQLVKPASHETITLSSGNVRDGKASVETVSVTSMPYPLPGPPSPSPC